MARGRRGKGKNQAKRFLLAVIALVLAAVYPVQEQLTKETGGAAVSDGSTLEVHYLDASGGRRPILSLTWKTMPPES